MDPTTDPLIGRVFDGYTLQSVIGKGGAGTVYLASKADAPEQRVAIKVLIPAAQATAEDRAEFKERFAREAKALQLLQHPHILSLLAYGEDEASGLSYMVLPYLSGGTLATRLAQGALPFEEIERDATQIAEALDYAHGQGVVHRDIKPGNVLLDEKGAISLADFGIAKIFDAAGTTLLTITNTGQVMGTADYMSPEQAQGEDVTAATDIYGLGMVLYHLVTGKVPFEGKSLTQILLQIATTPPIPPRRLRDSLPPPAEAAILKALAKKPVDRFASAGELAKAFALGLRGEWAPGLRQATTMDAFTPNPTAVVPPPRPRRSRPTLALIGLSALALLAICGSLLVAGVAFSNRGGGGPTSQANTGATATATSTTATNATAGLPTATNVLLTATDSSSGSGGPPPPQPTFTPTFTPTPTGTPTPTFTPTPTPTPPSCVGLQANAVILKYGQSVTLTSTACSTVTNTGYMIDMWDVFDNVSVAGGQCSTGITCQVTIPGPSFTVCIKYQAFIDRVGNPSTAVAQSQVLTVCWQP
jgi:serine/threonine-protein kinase